MGTPGAKGPARDRHGREPLGECGLKAQRLVGVHEPLQEQVLLRETWVGSLLPGPSGDSGSCLGQRGKAGALEGRPGAVKTW